MPSPPLLALERPSLSGFGICCDTVGVVTKVTILAIPPPKDRKGCSLMKASLVDVVHTFSAPRSISCTDLVDIQPADGRPTIQSTMLGQGQFPLVLPTLALSEAASAPLNSQNRGKSPTESLRDIEYDDSSAPRFTPILPTTPTIQFAGNHISLPNKRYISQ